MLRLVTNSQASLDLPCPFSKADIPPEKIQSSSVRIMILDSGILLDDLIMELICDVSNLEILITRIDQEEAIAQAIMLETPQVVILCDSDWFSVDKLGKLLETSPISDTIQIVVVSWHDSSLVIKNSRHHSHTNFTDFVNCIKKNAASAG
jgi:hypothetical protein